MTGHAIRSFVLAVLLVAVSAVGSAQPAAPTLFIAPAEGGFHTYLAAAMHKKKVPVTVVVEPAGASFTLTAAEIEVETVTTGKRLVNCLFAYCAGIEDKASTSVTLTDASGAVVWSYSVNKGRGAKNRQSMAEAVAKHLKDEYLRPRR